MRRHCVSQCHTPTDNAILIEGLIIQTPKYLKLDKLELSFKT